MSLNLEAKKAVVAEVVDQVAQAQTMVLAQYRGVTVSAMNLLRQQARQQGVYLRVLKNTLATRAVANTPFEALTGHMVGPLIYGISADPVAAARVLHTFAKSNENFVIKIAAFDGRVIDVDEVADLANIPSREVLLAKLLGVMQAPVSGFARALAALAEERAQNA